jgi:hypothetical protein
MIINKSRPDGVVRVHLGHLLRLLPHEVLDALEVMNEKFISGSRD